MSFEKRHPRSKFRSGEAKVDRWISEQWLQSQEKHLSTTKVLLSVDGSIAGFYTLGMIQIDFSDLPHDVSKRLPKRMLPAVTLAWLGVSEQYHRSGIGSRLLAQALVDCHNAGQTFSFVAVIVDCITEQAKRFFERWDFQPLPGRENRLFNRAVRLAARIGR